MTGCAILLAQCTESGRNRVDEVADSGQITDAAIERLRERIGIPEPHPVAPHYLRPGVDAFRHVAQCYGDDNPLWWSEDYADATRWGGVIAPPPLVGGDSLIGEDEVPEVAADVRELMKGDPLRGVHAFYSASAREWWAPLRPGCRVSRRNALVGVLDKPSEFAERAVHEWTGQVFRDDDGDILSGQYRLMIRTERTKARSKQKNDAVELRPYTDEEIEVIDAQYESEGPRAAAAPLVGGRGRGGRGRAHGQGTADRHRHDLLARGDGHGALRGHAAPPRGPQPAADPAVLPPRRAQRARRDAAGPLGSRVRPPGRQPHHLRLRADAGDLAHPPLHRLDG